MCKTIATIAKASKHYLQLASLFIHFYPGKGVPLISFHCCGDQVPVKPAFQTELRIVTQACAASLLRVLGLKILGSTSYNVASQHRQAANTSHGHSE